MYFNLTPKKMNLTQPSRLLGAASGALHCDLKPRSRTCSTAPSFFREPQLGMKKCCPSVATSQNNHLRLFPGGTEYIRRTGATLR